MQDFDNDHSLVVFVDAFPYHSINKFRELLPKGFSYQSLTPTFGFSINQKALLFGGRTPDECGYFNEWVPKSGRMGFFERFCLYLSTFLPPKLEGFLHKLYSKYYNLDYYRIPFGMKYMWKRNPTEIYNRASTESSVITKYNYTRILYSDFQSTSRDEMVLRETMRIFNSKDRNSIPKNIFITLADCDSQLHRTGGTGEGSDDICNYYATEITALVKKFLNVFPNGNVVVLSDHGMSDVSRGFDVIAILKSIAKPSNRTYIYFVDATMLRIWYFDQSIKMRVRNSFKACNYLTLLSDEMRIEYGVVNKEFGDDIYTVSKDNIMFEPNFYGRKRVNGMHGYIPTFDSQKGIFISNSNSKSKEIHSNEVFPMLCDVK